MRRGLLALLFISLSFPIAIQQTLLGCALAFMAYVGWRNKGFSRTPLDRPLLFFFAAFVVSALFCPSVLSSLLGLRKLWLVGAFFIVYYGVADPREAWRLVFLMMVAAVGMAAYGVLQHYTGIDLNHAVRGKAPQVDPFWFGQNEGFRTEGFFPSGITYAHNMLFPLTLLTTWLIALPRGRRERLGAFAGWLVMVLALIFSLTRGVWIAYFVIIVALGIIKGGRAVLTVSLALILLGGFLFLLNPGVRERAMHAFDLKTNLPRSLIWQANIDMARDRPLLGWGYGNYKRFREPYYQRYPEVDTDAHAHNNLLQMWVDGGVVSFAAFLFLFWSILKRGWAAYRRLPPEADSLRVIVLGGTLSIVGFFIAGFTQYNFGDAEVVLVMWSITGLLMRAYTWTQEGADRRSLRFL